MGVFAIWKLLSREVCDGRMGGMTLGWAAARLRKRRFHVHRGNLAGMLEPSSNGLPLTIIDCELYGEPYLVLPSPRLIETCCQSARAFLVIRIFRCDASPIHQRRVLFVVSSPSPRQNAVLYMYWERPGTRVRSTYLAVAVRHDR